MNAIFRDTEGNTIPAPKARSWAAIKRGVLSAIRASNSRPMSTGSDATCRRAFQYAMWSKGAETPHSTCLPYSIEKWATWDRAPDGSKRVRQFQTDFGRVDIPHWDFTPDMFEAQGAFA